MSWNPFHKLVRSARSGSAARFVLPKVVLEIEPDFVAGARLARGTHALRRLGIQELEAPCLRPGVHRPNLTDAEGLRAALRQVEAAAGSRNGSFGLLVPDGAVRMAFLSFQTLPDDPRQAEALVSWRMRENLSFPPEEARSAYQALSRGENGVEVLVTVAKASVLAEYELLRESSNGGPRLVLPATLALLPLLSGTETGGELLVHVCSGWMTAVVLEGGRPRAWRTRDLDRAAPEALAAQVAAEAARVLASARDRQSVEIGRVWLCERPPSLPGLEEALAGAVSAEVIRLAPSLAISAALPVQQRTLFERYGAALAGLLANA